MSIELQIIIGMPSGNNLQSQGYVRYDTIGCKHNSPENCTSHPQMKTQMSYLTADYK
jgi:hypothetical protein